MPHPSEDYPDKQMSGENASTMSSQQAPPQISNGDTPPRSGALLSVSDVGFDYEHSPILSEVSLEVGKGEFLALVGPSGCGKSTLLNLVSGVLSQKTGTIVSNGLTGRKERLGSISYMQQKDLLLPWRTVAENGRLGLELRGESTSQSSKAVGELARVFGIADVLDHMPWQLSGGMRQRVALLRAVLPDNPVLLLDEPFGALDAITRQQLQRWLLNVLDVSEKAVVLVTHDVEEAILLADRVVVMAPNPGRIVRGIHTGYDNKLADDTFLSSSEFLDLKSTILGSLETEEMVI